MPLPLIVAALLVTSLADHAGYAKGRELYEAFEYEQALLRFQELSVRSDLVATERAEVLLWVALCLDGVGRSDDADRSMLDAVRLDANVALPTATLPQILARFQSAVEAVRAEHAGPAAPAPPPAAAGPPPLALGLGAGGGVALLGSVALGVVAAERFAASTDPARYVDERAAAHDTYAWCLAGAAVTGLVGAGLIAGAAFVLASPAEPPTASPTGSGG